MEYSLTLSFICENGDKRSISTDGVKENLDKDQVTALMDTIISKNIFFTKNGALTKKSGAQLTRKAATKFELVYQKSLPYIHRTSFLFIFYNL